MQQDERVQLSQFSLMKMSDGLILSEAASGRIINANPAAAALYESTPDNLIGRRLVRFMRPDGYRQLTEAAEAAPVGTPFTVTIEQSGRDGTPFTLEINSSRCTYHNQPCTLSVLRDVSERIEGARALQRLVEMRTREQATLLTISERLAADLELKPELILEQLGVIIEYTRAVLFELEDLTLVKLAERGSDSLGPLHIRLNGAATLSALLNGQRPQRIADVWNEDAAARALRALLHGEPLRLLEGVKSWMWVPLAVKGRVVGGIGVGHVQPDYFTAHHGDLALALANQAAIALVNAQLYEQAQTLASLQERQRLARNLHDAINQSLFSAGLIAEVLPRLWVKNPAEGQRALADLRRLMRGAQAEMRGLLAELRPQVLIDSELGDLLRQLSNAFTGRTNVPVALKISGQGALPMDVQIALYRICQEALNNIVRHARAGRVVVELQHTEREVGLEIRDDGRGFDPEQIPPGHYGLKMMRERAEAADVKLVLASRPGGGTTINVRWDAGGANP